MDYWTIALPMLVLGAGVPACIVTLTSLGVSDLPPEKVTGGSGLQNFIRVMSMATTTLFDVGFDPILDVIAPSPEGSSIRLCDHLAVPVSIAEKRLMQTIRATILAATLATIAVPALATNSGSHHGREGRSLPVQLGPRPFFLVEDMADSPMKSALQQCAAERTEYLPTTFSIGHRGAPLQFPEHTKESYQAAARMGAGVLECDVAFTKDKELVCRHAQNDLHTTTDILVTPLAEKCTRPFTPATFDAAGTLLTPASAECRTSDITLAEFETLRGKMDASNPRALTPAEYLGGTASYRTDLYAGPTSGTLLTHKESIELFKSLNVDMTPELKTPVVTMPFDGFTQQAYAQKLIDEYKAAGVPPARVWPQSFLKDDVVYWVNHEPAFGPQAVYLDDAEAVADLPSAAELAGYKAEGIQIVAPPIFALIALDGNGEIVPSQYARDARQAGLDIIAWSLERSGVLADGDNGFYVQTVDSAIRHEGDVYRILYTLSKDVGVLGVFSDWPATTSFFANCKGLP